MYAEKWSDIPKIEISKMKWFNIPTRLICRENGEVTYKSIKMYCETQDDAKKAIRENYNKNGFDCEFVGETEEI